MGEVGWWINNKEAVDYVRPAPICANIHPKPRPVASGSQFRISANQFLLFSCFLFFPKLIWPGPNFGRPVSNSINPSQAPYLPSVPLSLLLLSGWSSYRPCLGCAALPSRKSTHVAFPHARTHPPTGILTDLHREREIHCSSYRARKHKSRNRDHSQMTSSTNLHKLTKLPCCPPTQHSTCHIYLITTH